MKKLLGLSLMLLVACSGTEVSRTSAGEVRDTGTADSSGTGDATEDTSPDSTADTTPDSTADTTPDTAVDTTPTDTGPVVIPDGPAGTLPPASTAPRGYSSNAPAGQQGDACRTGQWWVSGNSRSSAMVPGGECIQCHRQQGGPSYAIAGTIMGDYNDAENCRGVQGAIVEIIGADGVVTRLTSNAAGNFYQSSRGSRIVMPYTAQVTMNGQTYVMETETSNGDCNSCHTATGNGDTAGRIVFP